MLTHMHTQRTYTNIDKHSFTRTYTHNNTEPGADPDILKGGAQSDITIQDTSQIFQWVF